MTFHTQNPLIDLLLNSNEEKSSISNNTNLWGLDPVMGEDTFALMLKLMRILDEVIALYHDCENGNKAERPKLDEILATRDRLDKALQVNFKEMPPHIQAPFQTPSESIQEISARISIHQLHHAGRLALYRT